MDAVDTLHIWMAGLLYTNGDNNAGFLSTHDGGITWDTTLTGFSGGFDDIEMYSNDRGWASGNSGLLYTYAFDGYLLGDLNLDGWISAADVVLELNKAFLSQPFPAPEQEGDVNCDGSISPSDVVLLLQRTFLLVPFPCS